MAVTTSRAANRSRRSTRSSRCDRSGTASTSFGLKRRHHRPAQARVCVGSSNSSSSRPTRCSSSATSSSRCRISAAFWPTARGRVAARPGGSRPGPRGSRGRAPAGSIKSASPPTGRPLPGQQPVEQQRRASTHRSRRVQPSPRRASGAVHSRRSSPPVPSAAARLGRRRIALLDDGVETPARSPPCRSRPASRSSRARGRSARCDVLMSRCRMPRACATTSAAASCLPDRDHVDGSPDGSPPCRTHPLASRAPATSLCTARGC
jgi:hypothetical protein